MKITSGIYKLTNKINNKIYIGKSLNLDSRLRRHKNSPNRKSHNQIIDHSIKKYGWKNFEVEILHEYDYPVDNWELLALETAFIDFHNSTDKNIGYNILLFSFDRTGTKHSKKTKRKLSNYKHNLGRKFNAVWRKNISLAKTGEKHPNWGKKHRPETIKKMKIARSRGPLVVYQKPVKQIDILTGEIIKIWVSPTVAAKSFSEKKCARDTIYKVCAGKKPSYRGSYWRFV